ncbi:tRNA (adenosine(37)-N6)-dimethylallyltransferase MiaA [Agaricicola taiwanensis]|uniref:tRNA (adenosine(37)-N6)-dimethylallyltransferase MiaA n=1 Tax=Agaricicola taiwanensis TaxID=591372 RepID=UPI001E5B5BB6|nr:tRNA (adenosine(37)-N6)-dimethylallyltransferase MiaA [Agaricicola taiwanensis]
MLIAGPTASGKSAVALELAEALGGRVVNADSMQVYRDLRVLTARPPADEEARAPHFLYGHVDGSEHYSVGRWQGDVRRVLEETDGSLPIIIGGTGLYFSALTEGLAEVLPIPAEVREHWRRRGRTEPVQALHEELARRDPVMAARLRPTDPQRVVRALEVIDGLGRSLASFQQETGGLLEPQRALRLVLDVEPEVLRQRINARFDAMVSAGAMEEVRCLVERRLDPTLPIMKAHGMPWLAAHIDGTMALDDAIDRAKGDTRRYAKRQRTWFRHRMADWHWVRPDEAVGFALQAIKAAQ